MQVGRANDAARVQPDRATFLNAIQKYAWADGALFQIYTDPGQVTDIALQGGEDLKSVGKGKSVHVSGDFGGCRILTTKRTEYHTVLINLVYYHLRYNYQ